MEDYSHCQLTLDIYKELRKDYDNIGTVLQSYLYRTEKDIEELNAYNANLRLVKGAYNEPAEVAFPKKSDVDKSYENMIKTHLLNGNYAGIATHDGEMVDKILRFIDENNIPKSQFEFQMLYGIRSDLQSQLAKKGYKVRVYIPYGVDWFGYFMRRLAERPENVAFVLKNAFK
jgi:proline dehydrogenase